MTTEKQDLVYIKDYLKFHFQMVIATYGDFPWIATVYYSIDDNMNIYFLTSPKTIHAQQIKSNPKVAIAIADSPQSPNSQKKGLQIYGLCEEVTGMRKITHAITLWTKTLNVTDKNYSYQGMVKKTISGRMYKVTPQKIKFFNEELWEEGQEKLIEL